MIPRLHSVGRLKVLDFDIETRRVGFHNGGRFGPDGCEPITIAASWVGDTKMHVWLQPDHDLPEMLEAFRCLYDEADMVTGHYIRKFDLPILNGSMLEHGLQLLGPKLAQDTKCDLVDIAGLSQSQENLSGTFELPAPKYHMSDFKWRKAARLDVQGVEEARKRASLDVKQHKALRAALLQRDALRAPAVWSP